MGEKNRRPRSSAENWDPRSSRQKVSPRSGPRRETISLLLFDRFVRKFPFCVRSRQFAEGVQMENISGKSRARFPWTFSCATMGLAVSVSLCFAQGNREAQIVTAPPEITMPLKCDSLDPEVCFDIYRRILQKSAPPTATRALNWSTKLEYLHYGPPFGTAPVYYGLSTPNAWLFGTVSSGWQPPFHSRPGGSEPRRGWPCAVARMTGCGEN
jgi:hypothetical protein